MPHSLKIQLALEDLLADLHHARRHDQLGRLALLAYCEVKGWARLANMPDLADKSLRLFSENPCLTIVEFLKKIDDMIATLELHEQSLQRSNAICSTTVPVLSRFKVHHSIT
ncbi:MAG: hypothetical protein CFE44_29075 [Burkholderiales bacterium PBB4]|nr:MAG: hypothetical protein CFE44_29075 [Burkholderiales bacterium PBB4]